MEGNWVDKREEEVRERNMDEWGENLVAELMDGIIRV